MTYRWHVILTPGLCYRTQHHFTSGMFSCSFFSAYLTREVNVAVDFIKFLACNLEIKPSR